MLRMCQTAFHGTENKDQGNTFKLLNWKCFVRDFSSCSCDCENYHFPGCDAVHIGRRIIMFQKSLLAPSKGYINYHDDGGKKFI
jgi:hypothetical protein